MKIESVVTKPYGFFTGAWLGYGEEMMKVHIKEMARRKGYSLYKLALIMGLPQQTVYSWASQRTQPNYDNMDRLCTILECNMGELFTHDDYPLSEFEESQLMQKAAKAFQEYKAYKEARREA